MRVFTALVAVSLLFGGCRLIGGTSDLEIIDDLDGSGAGASGAGVAGGGTTGSGGTGNTSAGGGGSAPVVCDEAECAAQALSACIVCECKVAGDNSYCGCGDVDTGEQCADGYCINGDCKPCIDNTTWPCADSMAVCDQLTCVSGGCTDNVQSSPETDVDCGGGICAPCVNGKLCNGDVDCVSLYCNDSGYCQACSDHDDCGGGYYCDAGVCEAEKSNFEGCSSDEMCSSGCCDTWDLSWFNETCCTCGVFGCDD